MATEGEARCVPSGPGTKARRVRFGLRTKTRRLRVIFTSGPALTETPIKNLQITRPNGPAILALGCPAPFRIADR